MVALQTKLVVFDLDGTLIDSAQTVTNILNEIRFDLGKPSLEYKRLIPWLSLGGEELMAAALEVSPIDTIHYLKKFRTLYFEKPTDKATVYPWVSSTLSSIESMDIHLAICTNKPRVLAEKILHETNLAKFFSFMNAGGDLKSKKPNRVNLDACLNNYKLKSVQSLLVGDSTVDQRLAANTGVPFIFFKPGYDDGVDEARAAFSINSHSELICHLKNNALSNMVIS